MSEPVIRTELGTCMRVNGNGPTSLGQRIVAFLGFISLGNPLAFPPLLSILFSAGKTMHTFLLRDFASDTIRILFNSEFSLGIDHDSVRDLSPATWPRIEGSES